MPPPIGTDAAGVTASAHQLGAGLDVGDLITRLEREALRLIQDLSQQGLEGDALADAVGGGLRDVATGHVDRAARGATSEAFNLGRNLGAQDQAEKVKRVVRSEVLDLATCTEKRHGDGVDRCAELDGNVYEFNSDEYFKHMPPNDCDGREQCRGFYIFLEDE
jgi:hypothetical protein